LKTPEPSRYVINSSFKTSKIKSTLAESIFKRKKMQSNLDHRRNTNTSHTNSRLLLSKDRGRTTSANRSYDDFKDNRTFGVPREATSNVVSANKFNFTPFKPELPGPCYYGTSMHPYLELGSNISQHNKYSLRPKTQKNPIEIVDENPGPGQYDPPKPKV
jgi:hypothetical protein